MSRRSVRVVSVGAGDACASRSRIFLINCTIKKSTNAINKKLITAVKNAPYANTGPLARASTRVVAVCPPSGIK